MTERAPGLLPRRGGKDKTVKKKDLYSIPNILSYIRILLIPAFAYCYLTAQTNWDYYFAAIILLLSGLTDMADGMIARKFGMITYLGKILDPVADKLTQATVAVCLAIRVKWMPVLLCVFLIKELATAFGGIKLMYDGVRLVGAKWFGKLSTAVFYVVMILIVGLPMMGETIRTVLIFISGIFLLFSFFNYIPVFFRLKKNGTDSTEK